VGFYGKFLVFGHCIQAGKFVLLGAGVLAVASGFYFYLRVLAASFWQDAVIKGSIPVPFTTKLVICLLMLGIIFFGISPSSVISYLTDMSVSAAIK
jgi:NADH-quinone oxidoreductase subunit N